MHPVATNYIEIRNNRKGEPRAFIAGTRIRVQDVVQDYERHGLTAEEIVGKYTNLSLAQIHASLAYYFENQEGIREALKADRKYAETFVKQNEQCNSTDADGDPVSS